MTLAQIIYRRISTRRMAHGIGHSYTGGRPCIPPLALAGMVDRILLRVRVEREDAAGD
jgi:hypothetical protein